MNRAIFWILLTLIVVMGLIVRSYHLFTIGFDVPFNLGGLFYEFSLQIIKNNFRLPVLIPYYLVGGLPFAYPPLAFYIQAILIKIINPSNYLTVNLLPVIFSGLSLLSFGFLANKVFSHKLAILVAAMAFSLIPIAFTEQIEGQGLSESMGTLSLIWHVYFLYLFNKSKGNKGSLGLGVAFAWSVLSSPGSAYASVLITIVYFVGSIISGIKKKSWKLFKGCLLAGLLAILISSPYWLSVVLNHGFNIFLTSFEAQHEGLIKLFTNIYYSFGGIALIWKLLIVVGLVSAFIKKEMLIIFLFMVLLLVPRELWIMSVPVSSIIGYGVERWASLFEGKNKLSLLCVFLILFLSYKTTQKAVKSLLEEKSLDINTEQIEDIKEMGQLIPVGSKVIVAANSAMLEWMPTLIKRDVVNNHYGLEWQPKKAKEALLLSSYLIKSPSTDDFADYYYGTNVDNKFFIILDINSSYKKFSENKSIKYKSEIINQRDDLVLLKISKINQNNEKTY